MTTAIYALRDPYTDDVRYIGQSIDPTKRLREHLTDTHDTPKVQWIRTLLETGQRPRLEILERGLTTQQAFKAEQKWITYGQHNGWPLTNLLEYDHTDTEGELGRWLASELDAHDWTQSEFGHRCGTSHVTISRIINGTRGASGAMLIAIASALDLPHKIVFHRAGLLPPQPPTDDRFDELAEVYRKLDGRHRKMLLAIAKTILESTGIPVTATGGNGKE